MNRETANTLRAGDRLIFNEGTQYEARGVVASRKGRVIFVSWDDGQEGAVHVDEMALFRIDEFATERAVQEREA
jgi:hypothetical protein